MSKNLPSSSDYEVTIRLRFSVFGLRFSCFRFFLSDQELLIRFSEGLSRFGFRFSASGGPPDMVFSVFGFRFWSSVFGFRLAP